MTSALVVFVFYEPGNYQQRRFGVFLASRKKKKMPATVSSASHNDLQRAEDKTKGIKMCQMNPSVREEDFRARVEAYCVGRLEWEERQVNTWCQRECRSPHLSFCAVQVRFEYICPCLSARLSTFICTFVCVCVLKSASECASNPL